MPSLLEAVGEIFSVRLTMVNIDSQVMTLELKQNGQTLTQIRESLHLKPEGWEIGGTYSFRELGEEAARRAQQAAS